MSRRQASVSTLGTALPSSRRGFTLLEATVALALVGIVAIGALETVAAESRTAAAAKRAAPAEALAAERMARLKVADADLLRRLPDSLSHGDALLGTSAYSWTAHVEPVPQEAGLITLLVEVRWDGGHTSLAERVYRPSTESAR